ncbi:MAG TPA: addiction module protein [Methylophilaceae bacterium]|jgi:putative addiction module component (TIGR02574 family)|nr:addiction module protein [Methylophilaceae bacterium]HQC28887.1 addiction module protein [Methylotenera sp.]
MKTTDIMRELANLPLEERALIADGLLQTLNPTQPNIEQAWVKVAQQRLAEISAGKVKTISAENVFKSINQRVSA